MTEKGKENIKIFQNNNKTLNRQGSPTASAGGPSPASAPRNTPAS